jgi:hypothetical protein
MDDEKLVYPAYEKMQKAGLPNVCVHKGLFPPSLDARFPHLRPYCDVRDLGKAAKDWPGLNFIIYHGAYRFPGGGGNPADALMRRQHGFAPLGAADGPVKRAILGENVARLYRFRREAELGGPRDRLAALKAQYEAGGEGRSNLRYGYVAARADPPALSA